MIAREATPQDAAGMAVRWGHWAAVDAEFPDHDSQAWFDQEFAGLAAGTILAAVLVERGQIMGFADGNLVYEPATREKALVGRHLIVRADYRGQGFGDRLMLRLLALARQSGASSLLTHGGPSARAVGKYFGNPMETIHTIKRARW